MLQNKCSADLSFDAVSTLGDATFFFKDKYVHPPCWNANSIDEWKANKSGVPNVMFFPPLWRYLWIKHNQQYDIKEGPINNFMPKIESKIDAAFWVPRRSTAYLIHGTDISYHTTPSWLTVCNEW